MHDDPQVSTVRERILQRYANADGNDTNSSNEEIDGEDCIASHV